MQIVCMTALTTPQPGGNAVLSRILIGLHDYGTGLDGSTFRVTADFPVGPVAPGDNLAAAFHETAPGVWELKLAPPIPALKAGTLTVSVADKQGNVSRIERRFSVEEARR